MQAQHPSSSGLKDTTEPDHPGKAFKPPRPLLATAVIGAALIGYLVHKTPHARQRLESMACLAKSMGDLSEHDAGVIADLLAKPFTRNTSMGEHHV
ncbi:hypothetical protein SB725_17485 [Pseudomonas sp. SIMBA_041]|uniref:hypothetical protein n=1 Tax=Pseudomonas sp. SIMBA_041 TaxID=3085782 RepID=UPI00397BDFFD